MDIQAQIPPARAAVHNFILDHDAEDLDGFNDVIDENPGAIPAPVIGTGSLLQGPPGNREKDRASEKRDEIAQAMWDSYLRLQEEREEIILE